MPGGVPPWGGERAGLETFHTAPAPDEREHYHHWHDVTRIADEFEAEQKQAGELLLPRYRDCGDNVDDPGALSVYEKHRLAERKVADFYYYEVAPFAENAGFYGKASKLRKLALKMYNCRLGGPLGLSDGKPIIEWESKCGHSKLCPDEARHEAQRLYDQYADAVIAHHEAGGKVYKFWPTLPNYPGGRLREGMRHLAKRWRNKFVRAIENGESKFGHVGSLLIIENPLSKHRDWNVHGNVIMLTDDYVSFKKARAHWGCNIEMRRHRDFTEGGLKNLFNEMVKYSLRTVPDKSDDKSRRHKSDAPPLIEWTPAEAFEWHFASHGFRRTRSYGSLHGIGKPDKQTPLPRRCLGRVDYEAGEGYRITWRKHDRAAMAREFAANAGRSTLESIRGDNSTNFRHQPRRTRGP